MNTAKTVFPYFSPLFILFFFPSVTMGILGESSAEVMPWGILVGLMYARKFSISFLLFVSLLLFSSIAVIHHTGLLFQPIRSFSAYLNALLPMSVVHYLPHKQLIKTTLIAKWIFILLIILGILQYLDFIPFLNGLISFLQPRASSSTLDSMGRGVTLLSTEPARAGVEIIFLYLVFRTVFLSKKNKYYADLFIALFLIIIIQSAMAVMLYMVFVFLEYRLKALLIGASIMLLFSIGLVNYDSSGRTIELVQSIIQLGNAKEISFLLLNTSGHRVISIFSSFLFGIVHPFGGGVGNWEESSVLALQYTGIDLSQLRYFIIYGMGEAIPIRSSGFISNLILDIGVIGVSLFFVFFNGMIKKYDLRSRDAKLVLILIIIKILFIGSVGTTVSFICAILCLKHSTYRYLVNYK